jgi:hypothetical protein
VVSSSSAQVSAININGTTLINGDGSASFANGQFAFNEWGGITAVNYINFSGGPLVQGTGMGGLEIDGDVIGFGSASFLRGAVTFYNTYDVFNLPKARFDMVGDVNVQGVVTAGSSATILTDPSGKILSSALNVVSGAQGGTGVNNGNKTITLGGNFATSGEHAITLQATGTTNVTLPAGTATLLSTNGSGAGLTNLNASALVTGTVPAAVLPADVTRLGPTIELNTDETTGDLAWARVNKTGATLADLPTRDFSDLQNKPATLAGYGITDAVQKTTAGDVAVTGTTTLHGNVTVKSVLRIPPAGDLPMGDFDSGEDPSL